MRLRAAAPAWAWPAPLLPGKRGARASVRACATAATVRSLQNARVKAARALLRRRGRERAGALLVEGHRLVLDALAAGCAADAVFYTAAALERGEYGRRLRAAAGSGGFADRFVRVSDEVMESISDTVTPQGCVAVIDQPEVPLPKDSSLVRTPTLSQMDE